MLSSEILENQFGATHVEVLYGDIDKAHRIIQTVADDSQQVLELSWVKFAASGTEAFPDTHRHIVKDGKSMGTAYDEANILFNREVATTSLLQLPSSFNERFKVDGRSTVVEVAIFVGHQAVHYCDILETYSPEVNWPDPPTHASPSTPARITQFSELITTLAPASR